MRRIALLPLTAALALTTACASHTQLPAQDRANLERELTGRSGEKFLKLSYFVTPFFGDATKKLLTAVPPEEVRMLNHPDGSPVNPGAVEKVLPAGTRARILKVEFPTSWVVTERVPYTPRTQPWVYLQIEGEHAPEPFVLVLRPAIKTQDEFLNELGRYLADQDPSKLMDAWSDAVRQAVKTKTVVNEMPSLALEMAWGYPEHIKVELEGTQRNETWEYPGRKRIAHLTDGRVVKTEVQ